MIKEETLGAVLALLKRRQFADAAALCDAGLKTFPGDIDLLRHKFSALTGAQHFRAAMHAAEVLMAADPVAERQVRDCFYSDPARHGLLRDYQHKTRLSAVILVLAASVIGAEILGRIGAGAFLFFIGGIAGATFVAEVVFRLWAYRRFGLPGERLLAPLISAGRGLCYAFSAPFRQFNARTGFDYRPDLKAVRIALRDGKIVECGDVMADANGNIGHSDVSFAPDCLNILVVGDSFTALPGNGAVAAGLEGVEWPWFLKQHLGPELNGALRVINCGRDSIGVLQMLDIAADKAEHLKPDLVVIALIMRDLERPRRYYSWRRIAGHMREFMHHDPVPDPDLRQAIDTAVIDDRITRPWAEKMLASGASDTLTETLLTRYDLIRRRASARMFSLFAPDRSCLLDWLTTGTVFTRFDLPPHGTEKTLSIKDYSEDPAFPQNLQRLRQTGAEVLLLHLPEGLELRENRHSLQLSPELKPLLDSLTRHIGSAPFQLGKYINLPDAEVREKFNRMPHDRHPSAWAKSIYGVFTARLLLLKSQRVRDFAATASTRASDA